MLAGSGTSRGLWMALMGSHDQIKDDQMLRVYAQWKQQNPELPMKDFAQFVRSETGEAVSGLLTYEEAEFLMTLISEDPIIAEAMWEGMESGP